MRQRDTISGKPKWKYWADLRAKSARANPIKRTAIRKKTSGKRNKIPGLYEFMLEMIRKCDWICDECDVNCYTSDQTFQLAAQAHILPKNDFPSVALLPENILCLPSYGCGHHSAFDLSYERKMKMKVWPRAKKIILTVLIPKLTAQEYRKLPEFLKTEYEEKIK